MRVTARLTDRDYTQVLWSQSYDRALTTAYLRRAGRTGGGDRRPAGPGLRRGQHRAAAPAGAARPETLFAYDCVQRAFAYRRTFAPELYPPSVPASRRRCAATPATPAPGPCWPSPIWTPRGTAWSSRQPRPGDGGRSGGGAASSRAGPEQRPPCSRWRRCTSGAATTTRPSASSARRSRSTRTTRRAWRSSAGGWWSAAGGTKVAPCSRKQSTAAWSSRPGTTRPWRCPLPRRRSPAGARRRRARQGDCCPGYAVLAITEAAVGHAAAARAALDEALRQSPLLARDPVAYWANFQFAPEVIERLNAGLVKAGLPLPVPAAPSTDPGETARPAPDTTRASAIAPDCRAPAGRA